MPLRRRRFVRIGWVLLTLTWSLAANAGRNFYVSPSGNDDAAGTSRKTAWRTLDRVAAQTFAAGDRLLLEAGAVHRGSIQLDRDHSAGDIEIGAYGQGRAILDAGSGSGIVITNLSGVKISSLEIRGSGQETNTGDGILIVTEVDPVPPNTIHYSNFEIDVEVQATASPSMTTSISPGTR